jgi:hypothetical protein
LTRPQHSLYCDSRLGGIQRWSVGKPPGYGMRVADDILDCICYLSVKDKSQSYKHGGTAFLLGVPIEGNKDLNFPYLVTAKHCVERAKEYGNLFVRLNSETGEAVYVETNTADWIYSEDESEDAAVLPFLPPEPLQFRIKTIPIGMAAVKAMREQNNIGIGDDIIVTGLFSRRWGERKNLPIVRAGVISAMADESEPLKDDAGLPFNAHLVELRSIGGLSGSPVFVYKEWMPSSEKTKYSGIPLATTKIFLLGIIRGHYDETRIVNASIDFSDRDRLHFGIATVTPIEAALKIIYGDDFVKNREKVRREYDKQNASTQDSAFGEPTEGPSEGQKFDIALRAILLVSKTELQQREKEWKRKKDRKKRAKS